METNEIVTNSKTATRGTLAFVGIHFLWINVYLNNGILWPIYRWIKSFQFLRLVNFQILALDRCKRFVKLRLMKLLIDLLLSSLKSSRPYVFYKKGVFKLFAKFTGKHLCHSLFFNKFAGLRPATATFLQNTSKKLLPNILCFSIFVSKTLFWMVKNGV